MVGVRPAHGSVGEDERSDGCDHAALFCCDLIFMIWAALYSHKSELQVQVFDLWAPLLDWCTILVLYPRSKGGQKRG